MSGKIIKSFVIILVLIVFTYHTASALSNSGDGTWKYQQEIIIHENSGETLADYQVLIELEGDDFPSEAQSDGADIRFIDENVNEVSYWLEEFDSSNKNAKIWVKVPKIPANRDVKVTMWYGNPDAENVSDGDVVFEFFDDFNQQSLDLNKWEIGVGSESISISSGQLLIKGGNHITRYITSKSTVPSNRKEMMTKYWIAQSPDYKYSDGDPGIGFSTSRDLSTSIPPYYAISDNDETIQDYSIIYINDGSDVFNHVGKLQENYDSRGKWSEMAIARIDTTFYGTLIEENGLHSSKNLQYTKGFDFNKANVLFINANNDNLDVKFNWILVREYTSPEPTITLDLATVTYADEGGNIQEVLSEPISIKVIPSTEGSISGTSHNPSVSTASVHLHGEKTDVVMGEDILLKLSAVNKITKPIMTLQVILIPPSGMSVTSADFVESGAGQYTSTYTIEPGDGRDIEVGIRSNQVGDFIVNGEVIYFFGDDMVNAEEHILSLPIKVRAKPGADGTESPQDTPGFAAVVAAIGMLLVVLLIKRRR